MPKRTAPGALTPGAAPRLLLGSKTNLSVRALKKNHGPSHRINEGRAPTLPYTLERGYVKSIEKTPALAPWLQTPPR